MNTAAVTPAGSVGGVAYAKAFSGGATPTRALLDAVKADDDAIAAATAAAEATAGARPFRRAADAPPPLGLGGFLNAPSVL